MTCNGPLPVFSYPSLPAGLVVALLSIFAIPVCAQDVLTYHNNNFRNGAYTRETTLTPTNVNSAMFGKLFVLPADGLVDAEPLCLSAVTIGGVMHNLVIVVTEHASV